MARKMKLQGLVIGPQGDLQPTEVYCPSTFLRLGSQLQGVAHWLFDAGRCIPLCS